jgi:hypothetical protein
MWLLSFSEFPEGKIHYREFVIVQNLAKVSDGGSRMAFCDWQAGLVGKIMTAQKWIP